jgi:hypothetical protein
MSEQKDPSPPIVVEDDGAAKAAKEWDKPFDSAAAAAEASKPKKVVTDWKLSKHENDTKSKYGPEGEPKRDIVGYGANPVQPHWPRSAKVALNFVINFEEGSENCLLHGDSASENLLSDLGPNCASLGMYRITVICCACLLYAYT